MELPGLHYLHQILTNNYLGALVFGAVVITPVESSAQIDDNRAVCHVVQAQRHGWKRQSLVLSDLHLVQNIVFPEVKVVLLDVIGAADEQRGHAKKEEHFLEQAVCSQHFGVAFD